MNSRLKIGIVAVLGIAGLVMLLLGLATKLFSVSLSLVFAFTIWIAAVLVYALVRNTKPGRKPTRTITDSGCRDALTKNK